MRLIFKPTTQLAARERKRAYGIAKGMNGRRVRNVIEAGFLFRAIAMDDVVTVTVLEAPTYFVMPFNGVNVINAFDNVFTGCYLFNYENIGLMDGLISEEADVFDPAQINRYYPDGYRVLIGNAPEWDAIRFCNNRSAFAYSYSSNALVGALTPRLDATNNVDPAHEQVRSLLMWRMNVGVRLTEEDTPAGRPRIGGEPAEAVAGIGAIEIAGSALGLGGGQYVKHAGPCATWSADEGVVSAVIATTGLGSFGSNFDITQSLKFYHYKLKEPDKTGELATGEIVGIYEYGIETLPGFAQPDKYIYEPLDYDPAIWTREAWSYGLSQYYSTVGYPGSPGVYFTDGQTYAEYIPTSRAACHAKTDGTLAVMFEVKSDIASNLVEYQITRSDPYEVMTKFQRSGNVTRHLTCVGVAGKSLANVSDRHDNEYDQRWDGQDYTHIIPRLSVEFDGVAYFVCSKSSRVRDISPPYNEPDWPVIRTEESMVSVSKADIAVVSDSGSIRTVSTSGFYPVLYELFDFNGNYVQGDGRRFYGITTMVDNPSNRPLQFPANLSMARPFCEYADGFIAIAASPSGDYLSDNHSLHILIVDLRTCVVVFESGPLLEYYNGAGQSPVQADMIQISCLEQGVVEDGKLVKFGTLLITHACIHSPPRLGAIYKLSGLDELTKLSSIDFQFAPPIYFMGSMFAPASFGKSTNRAGIKRKQV
jgi:hypothetical protein